MLAAQKLGTSSNKVIRNAIAASLFLHFIVFAVKIAPQISQHMKEEKVTKIRLVEPTEPVAVAVETQKRAKLEMKRQIVTSEKSELELKPVPSRFLSEHTQAVDRQTVASSVGSFKEAGKGVASGADVAKAKAHQAEKKSLKEKVSLAALGKVKVPKNKAKVEKERDLASLGIANGKDGVAGYARNNDYVEDIPLGDMTKLNTTEFKYYGFYHRIKQRLEQHWGKTLQEKAEVMVKKGRAPASADRITALSITLDDQGQIVDIELRSSSGVSEFDEAAIDSFNKAGPFPNPPKGMMVNGKAIIEWGFVVKS